MKCDYLLVMLLLGALLACKEGSPRKAPKNTPTPGETPSAVLSKAEKPEVFEGQKIKVTGLVVDSGGGTAIQCCGFDAGPKKQLRACMKTYSCISGVCSKKAPPKGAKVTLECVATYLGDTPLLTQCVEVAGQ